MKVSVKGKVYQKMIKRIAVLGAGQMGQGIAQVCAVSGYEVQLIDVNPQQLEKAKKFLSCQFERQVQKKVFLKNRQKPLTGI